MSQRMTRILVTTTLTMAALFVRPAPARAEITAFWGFSPTPEIRQTRGLSIGASAVLLGGEFEWANTAEKASTGAPGLTTYMFNGMLITPGKKTQLYLGVGWGRYRETLGVAEQSGFATSVGGGVKIKLAKRLKLRLDYRVFSLRGTPGPMFSSPKRFYAGLSLRI